MPNLFDESPLLPLTLLARHCPPSTRTGRPPHPSVLWRWANVGLKTRSGQRVRLETVRAGSATCSSVPALHRFFSALAAADQGVPTLCAPLTRQTAAEAAATSRALVKAGLKAAR